MHFSFVLVSSKGSFFPVGGFRSWQVRLTVGGRSSEFCAPTLKAFGRAKVKQVSAETGSFASRNPNATDGTVAGLANKTKLPPAKVEGWNVGSTSPPLGWNDIGNTPAKALPAF